MKLPAYEFDIRSFLAQLRQQYSAEEIRRQLSQLLTLLQRQLAGTSADARLVATTYRRVAQRKAEGHEIAAANQALRRLLAELGVAVVGILPGGFITLPALYAVARHYQIELVPGVASADESDPSGIASKDTQGQDLSGE